MIDRDSATAKNIALAEKHVAEGRRRIKRRLLLIERLLEGDS
jgi:hypothetical protein